MLNKYKQLISTYHNTLDLMSTQGLAMLDNKIADSLIYADAISDIITKFKLDSETKILDIGSGVGLPAIPIAIALPQYQVVLTERRMRRASFLKLVVGQLELANTTVFSGDVRNFTQIDLNGTARIITAQVVGSFSLLYNLTKHLQATEVTIISTKGNNWLKEKQELAKNYKLAIANQEINLKTHGKLIALHFEGFQRPSSENSL